MARIRKQEKQRKPRVLTFKFRVTPTVRMPRSVMFQKLDEFMATGEMADDLELLAADFGRSNSVHVRPGQTYDLESMDMVALRQMYAAFKDASRVRFEKVG